MRNSRNGSVDHRLYQRRSFEQLTIKYDFSKGFINNSLHTSMNMNVNTEFLWALSGPKDCRG
jgi:hypothetical protein